MTAIRPAPTVGDVRPYGIPRAAAPVDLLLDGNEGAAPPAHLLAGLADVELVRRYPDARPLEVLLATRLGIDPARVVVTAGADEALERACRAVLAPGRSLVLPVPTFEMLARFGHAAGADIVEIPWDGPSYPTEAVLAAIGPETSAIAVVSPNNPTGAVATAADLRRLSAAAPGALLLVDLAYVEFADDDLTATALALPNAVAVRTLSKAWGLAGLRVGYAIAAPEIAGWLRAVGMPYTVSRLSLHLAAIRLAEGEEAIAPFVAEVRRERAALAELLTAHGATPVPSAANFVFARHPAAAWLRDGLAGLGIAIRIFTGQPRLAGAVRITCPGDRVAFARIARSLAATLAPQALLFDMDGVLADVSGSYRRAIVATAESYGVPLAPSEVTAAKAEGQASNDWELTQRLLARHGVEAPLAEVTERFEALYQGTPEAPGLRSRERLACERALLERLAARLPLAVVTGRPRSDALRFLESEGLTGLFQAVVCMEDGPGKPDPGPVREALSRLGLARAWMVGDTPDDVRAARAAGVVPIGLVAPGDDHAAVAPTLSAAGAARIIAGLEALEGLLTEVER